MSSFRKSTSIQLGFVGLLLGAWSGFVIRDEYYYPSYARADELIAEYYKNDKEIDREISELETRLKAMTSQGSVTVPSATASPKAGTKSKAKKEASQ